MKIKLEPGQVDKIIVKDLTYIYEDLINAKIMRKLNKGK